MALWFCAFFFFVYYPISVPYPALSLYLCVERRAFVKGLNLRCSGCVVGVFTTTGSPRLRHCCRWGASCEWMVSSRTSQRSIISCSTGTRLDRCCYRRKVQAEVLSINCGAKTGDCCTALVNVLSRPNCQQMTIAKKRCTRSLFAIESAESN